MKVLSRGDKIEIGISEPADFFLETGGGPYFGRIDSVGEDEMRITFEQPLTYRGSRIESFTAKLRYEGQTFANWDGRATRIVNMLVDVKGVAFLIGGIKAGREKGSPVIQ
jgi:hypothetical protein